MADTKLMAVVPLKDTNYPIWKNSMSNGSYEVKPVEDSYQWVSAPTVTEQSLFRDMTKRL